MSGSNDDGVVAVVLRRHFPDWRLRRAWPLKGGVSSRVTAIEIDRADGDTRTLVLRRHAPGAFAANPRVAAHEFALLGVLHAAGVPVPQPHRLVQSADILPTPCLVLDYVDGDTRATPSDRADLARHLAAVLSSIHRVDPSGLSFLGRQEDFYAALMARAPVSLEETMCEGRIRSALAAVWPPRGRNPETLLHGDFWPGNVLWRQGRIVAVLDWEDAALGDPLADVAHARLELLWAFGPQVMERFTRHYAALAPVDLSDLALWDLCAALRPISRISGWGLDPARETAMREAHRAFVGDALERLSDRRA